MSLNYNDYADVFYRHVFNIYKQKYASKHIGVVYMVGMSHSIQYTSFNQSANTTSCLQREQSPERQSAQEELNFSWSRLTTVFFMLSFHPSTVQPTCI